MEGVAGALGDRGQARRVSHGQPASQPAMQARTTVQGRAGRAATGGQAEPFQARTHGIDNCGDILTHKCIRKLKLDMLASSSRTPHPPQDDTEVNDCKSQSRIPGMPFEPQINQS